MDRYRTGGAAAADGWREAGIGPPPRRRQPGEKEVLDVGVLVRHQAYGIGQVLEVGGHGANRKARVRFKAGERTFVLNNVELEIVHQDE
jgi:DNA helicase-2/ATP-dependent DNA helicase PcrA